MNWVGGTLQAANQTRRARSSAWARQKEHFAKIRSNTHPVRPGTAAFKPSFLVRDSSKGYTDPMGLHESTSQAQHQTRLDDYEVTSAVAIQLSSLKARPSPRRKTLRQRNIKTLLRLTKGPEIAPQNHIPRTLAHDDPGHGPYKVEKLLDRRVTSGRIEYEVQWEGFQDTTWEPEQTLSLDVPHLVVAFAAGETHLDSHQRQSMHDQSESDRGKGLNKATSDTHNEDNMNRKRQELLQQNDWVRLYRKRSQPPGHANISSQNTHGKKRHMTNEHYLRQSVGEQRFRVPSIRDGQYAPDFAIQRPYMPNRLHIRIGSQTIDNEGQFSPSFDLQVNSRRSMTVASDSDTMLLDDELAHSNLTPMRARANPNTLLLESRLGKTKIPWKPVVEVDMPFDRPFQPDYNHNASTGAQVAQTINPRTNSDVIEKRSISSNYRISGSSQCSFDDAPELEATSDIAQGSPEQNRMRSSSDQPSRACIVSQKEYCSFPPAKPSPALHTQTVTSDYPHDSNHTVGRAGQSKCSEEDEIGWHRSVSGNCSLNPLAQSTTVEHGSASSLDMSSTICAAVSSGRSIGMEYRTRVEDGLDHDNFATLSSSPDPLTRSGLHRGKNLRSRSIWNAHGERLLPYKQENYLQHDDAMSIAVHVGGQRKHNSSSTIMPDEAIGDNDEIEDD